MGCKYLDSLLIQDHKFRFFGTKLSRSSAHNRRFRQPYEQAGEEVAMTMEESTKKTSRPQLVKLDTALKLAEKWVNNMTKSTEKDSTEVELEGRPLRLGLGAKVPRQSKVGPLNDPVERKLHAQLEAGKRKAAKSAEESSPSVRVGHSGKVDDDDDDDENLDSRTNLFSKKRVAPLTSSLQAKKKQK